MPSWRNADAPNCRGPLTPPRKMSEEAAQNLSGAHMCDRGSHPPSECLGRCIMRVMQMSHGRCPQWAHVPPTDKCPEADEQAENKIRR